jgi:hypothetical protein
VRRRTEYGSIKTIGGERNILAVWAGNITERQSDIFALAAWANDCERKLLGLHCGQMLDRRRHLKWAEAIVD